ncbi:hypothetical protein CTAM01_02475 [Colletotrichum tamarilloi]|uniref:Uncharacterized protein n=1 Tax=Colletotrichum tamarilloi TaxID=1209934 RepID=A0ABQ9RNX7_9PEZI|nr:uncharacterized protein CTAM01_02475 [Colletotrichum tamarilloi]KAK1508689.1 hypothetical protein CTAM01_02475 [Colletotrichum tamarilloi]
MPIPHVLLLLLMQQPLSLPPRLGSSSLPPPALPTSPSLQKKPQTDCRLMGWGWTSETMTLGWVWPGSE